MEYMKRFVWLALAFMSLVIVSCNENDERLTPPEKDKTEMTHDGEDSGNEQQDDTQPDDKEEQEETTPETGNPEVEDMTTTVPVAFLVSVEGRSAMDGLTRYALEIYSGTERVYETENLYDFPNMVSVLVAELNEGEQYTCLLWADNGTDCYDITDGLKSVRTGSRPSIAFSGTALFDTDVKKYEITLQPAVAAVTLETDDSTESGSGYYGISPTTPLNYAFNVATGNVEETDKRYSPGVDFTTDGVSGNGEVARFYTFAPTTDAYVDLNVDYNGQYKTVENLPIRKGRATTLRGDLSAMDFSIKITDILKDDTNAEL